MSGRRLRMVLGVGCLLAFRSADAAVEPAAPAPGADARIAAVEGVYKRRFQSAVIVPGGGQEAYQAEDIVEIVRYDATKVYFRAKLSFFNGHTCGLYGVARADGANFVYHEAGGGESHLPSCTLRISTTKTDLVLDDRPTKDGNSTCRAYCGMRGSFGDYHIPLKTRRPIRYLARLKASPQYHEAVAAHEGKPRAQP